MRKSRYFILLIPAVIFSLYACEKVVTLDLKNADKQVVVQGNVTNMPGPYIVNLNYTIPYYSSNTFPVITGAQVNIYDDAGNSEALTETTQGVYKTASLIGTPGRKYTIQIVANGNTYSGISAMALPLPIDSFLIQPSIRNSIVTGYRVTCKFTDPVGVGNHYRVLITSNDTANLGQNNSRIVSDKLTDGKQLSVSFRTKLISTDTVKILLQCIDKSTYDFYNTLQGAVGNSSISQFLAALPANPTNNISNKGLGYFAAYAVTTNTKVIP
ncbi:MAG TPA: DUF4249 domain-containing protein [Bacteroidia bacterium]|jgi:hypothetical protein|nr:DUF4249 domain-containing protein [Bacteroidia bacterium]